MARRLPAPLRSPLVYASAGLLLAAAGLLQVAGVAIPPIVIAVALVVLTSVVVAYRREHARAARALQLARSLERLAVGIGHQTEGELVLRSVPQSALALVKGDYSALMVRQRDEQVVLAGAGLAEQAVGHRKPVGTGIFGEVLRTRRTVVVEDYGTHPAALQEVARLGLGPFVGVPVFVHGELAASFNVARVRGARPFDAEERIALEGLAAHAAVALRNARLLELSRAAEQLARDAADHGVDALIDRITREAAAAFNAEFVVFIEIGERPRALAAVGAAVPLLAAPRASHGPLTRQLIADRAVVHVADYVSAYRGSVDLAAIAPGAPERLPWEVGLHATMAAPIVIDGRVTSALVVGTTDAARTFDVIDRQGVAALAQTAGRALRAAARRVERERRIERLTLLNELAWSIAELRDPERIAREACRAAKRLVPCDAFYVARYDGERRILHFILEEDEGRTESSSAPEGWTSDKVVPLGSGPTSQVVLTGEPYHTRSPDDPVQHRSRRFGDRARESASAVHVPLKSSGRVVGVLSAQSYTTDAYDAEDISLLQSLANVVANAFENEERVGRMRDLYLASVKALAAAVDARDPYTRSHSARVAVLSRLIAERLGLPPEDVRRIQLGALLHDVGKIGIPDAILNKPGPLTPEEWVIMRTHSALGASILEAVEPLRDLVPLVRSHHERFDGAGYPDGLAGERVPLGAYVIQAADAYEVIVSKRSYKEARSIDEAVAELRACSDTQFHPAVVEAFVALIERDQRAGAAQLARVAATLHEEVDQLAGPGDVLERLAADAQTHMRQLAILQRLAGEVSAVLDIDQLSERLLRIVCETAGYENGFVATLDGREGPLVIRAATGPLQPWKDQTVPVGTGISWWVVEHGVLQNVGDVREDTRYIGVPEIRSALIVPLRIGDETVGVIGLESTRERAFGRQDEILLTAVSHQIAAAVQVARLHRAAKTAAATDVLTGLPNRRTFFERLGAALAGAAAGDGPLTVGLVDIDLLKRINDRYGHGAGDEALVHVASRLSAGVRAEDLVARIGGDEFAVIFAGAPILLAERIMRRLAEGLVDVPLSAGGSLTSISWGLAEAEADQTADELVHAADRAMYRHKRRRPSPARMARSAPTEDG